MRRILVSLGVLVLLVGAAEYERVFHSRLPAARKVIVAHRYGNVVVFGSDTAAPRLAARTLVRAGSEPIARRVAEQIAVAVNPGDDSIVVATAYPSGRAPDKNLGYEVNLELWLPEQAEVDVRNSFGDVRLEGLRRASFVSNRYGVVEVERCRQIEVENRYGEVRLFWVEGPATIDNAFGNVVLRRTSGRVEVENSYGRVDADGSNGDVHITNRFGNVLARHGQGRLQIANRCGRVAAWVDSPELDLLNLASELGTVELNVRPGLPLQVGGATRLGEIRTELPFKVVAESSGQKVAGRIGRGGPAVLIDGLLSDFLIMPEDEQREDSNPR